jgi:DNA invertase Pin-like site-specific DNA recombinase
MTPAVAYYRTSSATNVAGDSEKRQREAVEVFADANGYRAPNGGQLTDAFYDAAVSGADPVDTRPAFSKMLQFCEEHDVKAILVENASRFARDLAVQLAGHAMLKARGIELIPVDAPTYFTDPSPTAELVRQILGAVAQFEKAALVAKLKHARDAKRAATGRCEGRKPTIPEEAIRIARFHVEDGESYRTVAQRLLNSGFVTAGGKPYGPSAIKAMLERKS